MSQTLAVAPRLTDRDRLLALLVIAIWGSNFVVMKWGLDRMPPLALCFWRFLLSFLPACLLIPRPPASWRLLIGFGVLTGVGQFGLLCIAMRGHISPGLASVVVQTQAFFNVALAALILREKVGPVQLVGCLLGAAGLSLIASGSEAPVSAMGLTLVLLAALSWASCNVMIRACRYDGNLFAFLVWSSAFAALPLGLLSLLLEGSAPLLQPTVDADASIWAILAWQAVANTLFGYAVWNSLIRRYSLSRIGPLTLLVPVFAMSLSALLIGEQLHLREVAAALLIVGGVGAPFVISRLASRRRPSAEAAR